MPEVGAVRLRATPDGEWASLTPRRLVAMLKPFGVTRTTTDVRVGDQRGKGWERSALEPSSAST
ncbi:MAG: hypothetical protein ACRDPC_07460 [Solirubrobacteraceae bacterium]